MAVNSYDCFFLLDSNRYNRNPGGISESLEKTIKDHGGEILVSRVWEERKLAYPINGQNKGTYWITYFNMETANLAEFNRVCNLDENIMRFLVTKVDPRLVDTLVSHTTGKDDEPEEEPEKEEEKKPAEAEAAT